MCSLIAFCSMWQYSGPHIREMNTHSAGQTLRLLVLTALLSLQDGHADNSFILYYSSVLFHALTDE